MTDPVEEFAREFKAEIDAAVASEAYTPYPISEFTRIVLEQTAEAGVFDNPIQLMQEGTFLRGRYSISGYSLSDEEDRLVLFTSLYSGELPPEELSHTALQNAAELAARFLWYSAKGLHEKIEPSNTEGSDLARRLADLYARIDHLRIVVLTDGRVGARVVKLDPRDGTPVEVQLVGIERLHRILGEGISRDDIVVDLEEAGFPALQCLDCGYEGDYRAYLTSMPGALLSRIYDRYGTRLLEFNVRAFLGVRGRKSVNAGLRSTLRDEPQHFLAYNNGIVATVDGLEVVEREGVATIRRLRGLQIVNGGQTTASIHRAARIEKLDVSAVRVPAKIILVIKQDNLARMVTSISKSANSQNTVQPADFSANDPFHIALEQIAANTWLPNGTERWFYERARGSYGAAESKAALSAKDRAKFKRETPKERSVSKTDLAKALNAWGGYPNHVSFGGQKNFQLFMQRLRETRAEGDLPDAQFFRRSIVVTIIFRALQKLARRKGFPAYQANIVAYTLAWLGLVAEDRFDFEMVWSSQAIGTELQELLKLWLDSADSLLRSSAGAKMPTEWAKRPDCWEAFKKSTPALPIRPPPEFAGSSELNALNGGERFSVEDRENIARVMALESADWAQLARWAERTPRMARSAPVAEAMARYAADGWTRRPSTKEAKQGMQLLQLRAEHEVANLSKPAAKPIEESKRKPR